VDVYCSMRLHYISAVILGRFSVNFLIGSEMSRDL